MKRLAFITGATSGIGKATAERLAARGFDIAITGRRRELLNELKVKLESQYDINVDVLCFDIRENKQVTEVLDNYADCSRIEILINNAGLSAGLSPIQEGDLDDWERMIDTNIKGLLYVSRKIIPHMVQNKKGHIVNIGSIAGRNTYVNGNVYCASKYAVEAITQGMRADLLPHGIKVSQIAPGAVETEFSIVRFHGDVNKAKEVYKGFEPLIAEDIADAIDYVISRPSHVNINDMLIMPTAQANAYYFNKKTE